MELKEFIKFLNKHRNLILLTTAVCGLIAVFISVFQPIAYEASTSIYVRREAQLPTDKYYTYDGYYSQQAAKEYTDTVLGLLKTTAIARRAVELSNLAVSANDLAGYLKTKKVSSQVINVSITRADEGQSRQMLAAVVNAVGERVNVLNQQGDNKFSVGPINTNPLITVVKPYWQIYIPLGILVGFGFGLLIASFREYSK